MRVDSIDNTMFTSNKTSALKNILRLANDKKSIEIKPIKNYAQYLREYGLDKITRNK